MKKLLLITLMLAFGLAGFSQTNESQNSGNWNIDGNWTLGHEPLASEDVVINAGHAITVQSITNAEAYTVVVEGTASLEVLGTLTLAVPTVYNSTTGETWMDRNLGASQVATSSTDAAAYGDLYQWGRLTDGHEIRNSGTTATLSSTDVPGHSNFITINAAPNDWRSPQNSNLWQGASGINNPCPSGFRLPTEAEWEAEHGTWASQNTAGAFGSPLKLVFAGRRAHDNGGSYAGGNYWSSTTAATSSIAMIFTVSSAGTGTYNRAAGHSVRCIKD